MDDFDQKLGSLLSNPELMGKIMSFAQTLGSTDTSQSPPPKQQTETSQPIPAPEMPDLSMLSKMAGFASQMGIDSRQKNLLNALSPYLSDQRLRKLEKAMRAAKLAQLASTALSQGR